MRIGLDLSHGGRTMLWRPLEPGLLVLGSNPECDLCIPDSRLPAVQCVVERRGDNITLINKDPGGTQLGDELVREPTQLADGDVITIGPVTACVRFEPDAGSGGRTRTLTSDNVRARGTYEVTAPEVRPGERWSIDNGVTIGSDATNDLVFNDPFVSSFHARLAVEEGRCVVRDLGSRNGVFVGERKVREGEVPPGAQLRVGKTLLIVTAAGPSDTSSVRDSIPRLVGESPSIERVRELIRRLASADAPVLITGETGTGKEVAARLLAELSPRAARPFVVLNCGSLSRNLIESELFGHEKGAFTGAIARKTGAFEAAAGGSLFLDEIGELPVELQPQLLRVLETGEVRRVGSNEPFHVDVRVLAATNRQVEQEVAAGTFREDLFHRLHVLTIELPPLSQRADDIEDLAHHFVAQFAPVGQRVQLSDAAIQRLRGHTWPGNVRELRNVIQRAVLLRRGHNIEVPDVTFTPSTLASRVETASATSGRTLVEIECDAIAAELRRFNGNKKEAAAALGISRSTIHRKIDEYDLG